MERTQFTFYRSFASALRRIRKDADRAKAYDAICDYALDGKEPDLSALPDAAAIAFELIRPVLDTGSRKAENGKRKAEKKQSANEGNVETKNKQTASKEEANRKQTGSEKEKEKEKEKELENECYKPLTPFLQESVKQWVAYKAERREEYKPVGLQKLVTQIANSAGKYGEKAVADVIDRSMAANYQGIVFDWLERGNNHGTNGNAGGTPAKTRDWNLDAIVL